ncbi:YjbH domain-containing protein [Ramlibacter sp. PS3R-8]|uniref:YjbH domain-containing protein n=1 Tax=Ramlibacter sp. PS3R-8 TaxID=3133437 RepID=UPI0030AD362B
MPRFLLPSTLFAGAALCTVSAFAAENTMTAAGFSGLGVTPNAHLLGWGRVELAYDNQLPGVVRDPTGHNFVMGFGLLPNLEVAGRLATNSLDTKCFFEECGARDLSASAKFGIGLDSANRFRIAAGVTDLGGSVTYFRTYYGVLTYNEGPWEASGGWAQRSGEGINGSQSPLHGPFAAAAWQPLPWVRGHLEYTDGNAWAGLRLFAPKEWLPEGWSAHIGANARLTDTNLTSRSWFSAGVSIPLYKVPSLPSSARRGPLPELAGTQQPLPAYEARNLPPAPPAATGPTTTPAPRAVNQVAQDEQLVQLATLLRARGLEDISIGRAPDGSIAIRANNATYNWNTADAIGAALGAIANGLGDTRSVYRLIVTQRQIPIVAVTGSSDCLRQWIAGENQACTAGELSTPGTSNLEALHTGVQWVVTNAQPSWKTMRFALSPVLRTTVGTEFGAFDYSAGASVAIVQPLWAGASAELRIIQELARSEDFQTGGVFYGRRVRNGVDRLAFTQTWRVPMEQWLGQVDPLAIGRWGLTAVTAEGTIGRFGGGFDGGLASLRWEPGEGKHRLNLQLGRFRNANFGEPGAGPENGTPILGSYRYNVAATRTYLEAIAGRFMFDDLGFQVGLRQWFTDFSLGLYYRRTRFDDRSAQIAGIELSVPIGPRKDMNPNFFQVTGTPRFSHGIATSLGESGGNTLRPGFGIQPPTPTLDATFNSDRASLIYFEDNIRRIRDAAR